MPKPLREGFSAVQVVLSPENPKFGGMRREGHRFSIPPNQFYDLQNTRLVGGEIVARGGQSKANAAAALSGTAVTGIWDAGTTATGDAKAQIFYMREPT